LKPPDKTGFLCNTKNAQPNKRQLPTTTTSSRQQPKKNSGTAATVSQPITAGINNLKQKQQQSIIDYNRLGLINFIQANLLCLLPVNRSHRNSSSV